VRNNSKLLLKNADDQDQSIDGAVGSISGRKKKYLVK